jgi:hypothetical protein
MSMQFKFMKLVMHTTNFILMRSPSGIFKFYFVYELYPFLALPCLNFSQLFMHDLWLNFGYVTPHSILNVHKIFHKIGLP